MRIVVAPDSFKESLTAYQAARAIEEGFRHGWPEAEIVCMPMADGGEGTAQAVVNATGGQMIEANVSGPLGEPIRCCFGMTGDGETAVVEIAAASGLEAVEPGRRNPMLTSSFGTGQMILAALDRQPRRILIGLGGSATVDGGAGLLQGLGARLLDAQGFDIGRGGKALGEVMTLDLGTLDPRLRSTEIVVACDVDSPLSGPTGAARVFGPQKGATPSMAAQLDENLVRWGRLLHAHTGVDVDGMPGAGTAGGTGAALLAVLGATLESGVSLVARLIGLEAAIRGADFVITGEGHIDSQTMRGKTPAGVAAIARSYNKPVIAFTGAISPDQVAFPQAAFDAIFCISQRPETLTAALANAAGNLRFTAHQAALLLRLQGGRRLATSGYDSTLNPPGQPR